MIITIEDDFDLAKIDESGQCFRLLREGEHYRFVNRENVIRIRPIEEKRFEADCTPSDWETVWRPYFDLDRNYEAVRKAISVDPFFTRAAEEGKGIRILRQDHWEMVISGIITQRKSVPAIRRCVEALCASLGQKIDNTGVCTFPSPEAVFTADDAILADCGLGYRLPYVKDAAERVCTGRIDLDAAEGLPDEALLALLKSIKGVGNKVADCIMLFAYGRVGRAPVDTWIDKIIRKKYKGNNPFPRFGNYAGIAQQYAFSYITHHRDEVG